MNKFFAIALFALVGATATLANDTREIGLLIGHETKFADFCLKERDEIAAAISSQVNGQTRDVFEIFFGAASEIADEVLSVEKRAVEEFTKELKSPSSAEQVPDEKLPEDQIQKLIEQGKREIAQQSNVFGRLVAAGKNVVGSVMYNVANSAIFVRLAKARSYMNRENMLYGIVQTCNQVAQFDEKILADFEAAKAELLEKHAGDADAIETIKDMTVQKLKCHTSKYISRVEAFCTVFKSGATAFMKMLGLGSNYKLPSEITTIQQ